MPHQNNDLSAQKCSCLSRCVRARVVVVKSDPSSAVDFPDFLEDNCKQKVVYHSELTVLVALVVQLRHVQFFRKNRRAFAWKGFVPEQLLLDLVVLETLIQSTATTTFGLKRVNPRFSICHDVIDVFRSTAIVFLEHFF